MLTILKYLPIIVIFTCLYAGVFGIFIYFCYEMYCTWKSKDTLSCKVGETAMQYILSIMCVLAMTAPPVFLLMSDYVQEYYMIVFGGFFGISIIVFVVLAVVGEIIKET